MNKTGKVLAAASVAAALTLSAACSSSGKSSGNEGKQNNTKGANVSNEALDKVVNASTKKGGTLNLWASQDVDFWDPARAYYANSLDLQRLYARTLVSYDAKPGKAGLTLVPDLAAEMPKLSDGGKTYTFKLRDGIKFEDGSAITSKDVKYGVERVFATDVITGGPIYLQQILDNGQNYPGPYKDKDKDKLGLKSVETPDDKTIVFHLPQPDSDFLFKLAMGGGSPVPKAKDTGSKYTLKPVSSGPYMIKSYEPKKKTVFVRNPNWDQATDPIRKALPDEIDFNVSSNQDDLDQRLLAGDIDLDAGQAGVGQAAQIKILQDQKLAKYADDPLTGATRFIAMATKVAPFDNIHCRKAVMYATDPTAQLQARGGPAAGQIAPNVLPPTLAGSSNYDPYGFLDGKPDLAKAKDELKACGKPDGFTTTVAYRGNRPKDVKQAEAIQASLKQIGVTVNTAPYDGAESSSVTGSPDNVAKKGYGLIVMGWLPDYPSGNGWLQPEFDGRFILKNGNNNYSELNDPEVNKLFDQARAAATPEAAAPIYTEITKKVTDLALYVPGIYDRALNYRNPRLTNVYYTNSLAMIDFQALGVQ